MDDSTTPLIEAMLPGAPLQTIGQGAEAAKARNLLSFVVDADLRSALTGYYEGGRDHFDRVAELNLARFQRFMDVSALFVSFEEPPAGNGFGPVAEVYAPTLAELRDLRGTIHDLAVFRRVLADQLPERIEAAELISRLVDAELGEDS